MTVTYLDLQFVKISSKFRDDGKAREQERCEKSCK